MIFLKLTFSSFFVFWGVLGLSGKPFWLRFGSSWGDLGAILAILGRLGPAKIQFESQVLERSKTSLTGMLEPSRESAHIQSEGVHPACKGETPAESAFGETPTAQIERTDVRK